MTEGTEDKGAGPVFDFTGVSISMEGDRGGARVKLMRRELAFCRDCKLRM